MGTAGSAIHKQGSGWGSVNGCLGFIDHEKLKILKRMRKESSSVQVLDFSKVLFRELVGGMPWQVALKDKEAYESW